jgi:hypothetical protein
MLGRCTMQEGAGQGVGGDGSGLSQVRCYQVAGRDEDCIVGLGASLAGGEGGSAGHAPVTTCG